MSVVYEQTQDGIIVHPSAHTPDYVGREDCIINPDKIPDLSLVSIVGGAFVPLSTLEIDKQNAVRLNELKYAKELELDQMWGYMMTQGLLTSSGIKVKTEPMDISMWEKAYQKATVKTAKPIPLVRDFDGKLHRDVAVTTILKICSEVNAYTEALWAHKVLLQEMAWNAVTPEALAAITWDTPTN